MKRTSVLLLLVLAGAAFALFVFSERNAPPSDEALIKNFRDKKLAYEHLRDLFLADGRVLLIADWGVETSGSTIAMKPPVADLSLTRYNEYMELLKQVDAFGVSRSGTGLPEACIYVWSAGFAGETQHEAVCWLSQPPADQVASMSEINEIAAHAGGKRTFVYRHVEANWYLLRDG